MASRGRKAVVVDQRELQYNVNMLEKEKTFSSRSELWAALCETEWARNMQPRPLQPQTAMMKAQELGIEIKTPKGARGRAKGSGPIMPAGGVKRKKKNFSKEDLVKGIPVEEREKLSKVIDRACNGSMKAAIKLKCLDCTNWQKQEVANCSITDCSLYNFRPYKAKPGVVELPVV